MFIYMLGVVTGSSMVVGCLTWAVGNHQAGGIAFAGAALNGVVALLLVNAPKKGGDQ